MEKQSVTEREQQLQAAQPKTACRPAAVCAVWVRVHVLLLLWMGGAVLFLARCQSDADWGRHRGHAP